jgi:hypothetical protein
MLGSARVRERARDPARSRTPVSPEVQSDVNVSASWQP